MRTFLLITELLPLRLSNIVVGTRNEVKTEPGKEKYGTASGTSLPQYVAHSPRKGFLDNIFFFFATLIDFNFLL